MEQLERSYLNLCLTEVFQWHHFRCRRIDKRFLRLVDNRRYLWRHHGPPEVLRYTTLRARLRTLTFSGLSASKKYNLELYASRANTGNSTIFTIGTTSITIVTDNNKTNKASFFNLVPKCITGKLVVNIKSGTTYNYLNGFILTEMARYDHFNCRPGKPEPRPCRSCCLDRCSFPKSGFRLF
jgi:hypothetical protein